MGTADHPSLPAPELTPGMCEPPRPCNFKAHIRFNIGVWDQETGECRDESPTEKRKAIAVWHKGGKVKGPVNWAQMPPPDTPLDHSSEGGVDIDQDVDCNTSVLVSLTATSVDGSDAVTTTFGLTCMGCGIGSW